MARLQKVKLLRDNIRKLGWVITLFRFSYNSHHYLVLFEDAKALGSKNDYIIAVLTFIDEADENRRLQVNANTGGFDGASASEIMDFFKVKNNPSAKGFFDGFYSLFNENMPEVNRPPSTTKETNLLASQLGKRDGQPNPDAIYCYSLKRNPIVDGKQYHRSVFNSNKAKLLNPKTYEAIKDDPTISFCYTGNEKLERDHFQLLESLSKG